MKRNTYVTAALFAVFAVLTVAYWMMDTPTEEPLLPITATLTDLDIQVSAEMTDNGEAEETGQEVEEDLESTSQDQEVMSPLELLRAELEYGRADQVSALMEIIASADFDAQTKSNARDNLTEIETLASSSRTLETVLRHTGFDDVLVRASADSVQISIQVNSLADVPTRKELVELYVLAGMEFGNHRHGNISIDFQPLN